MMPQMRRMHQVVFLCLCFLFCAQIATAQDQAQTFDREVYLELTTRAQEVIDRAQASDNSLRLLRSDLFEMRAVALFTQEQRSDRVRAIQEQITSLGPIPEDKDLEATEVQAIRVQLNADLEAARAPLIVAQEAYFRANRQIDEIDGILSQRQTRALTTRDKSPLNPTIWSPSLLAFGSYLKDLSNDIAQAWASPIQIEQRNKEIGTILALFLIALIFLFAVPYGLRKLKSERFFKLGQNQVLFGRFKRLFANVLLPLVGVFFLREIVTTLGFSSLRMDPLIAALPLAFITVAGSYWLAHFWQETNGSQSDGQRIKRLGWLLALFYLLLAANSGASWPTETLNVLKFPLILLMGYGLFRLGQSLGYAYRQFLLHEDALNYPLKRRGLQLGELGAVFSGVAGPLLAVLGFSQAGQTLVIASVLTLALAAFVTFLNSFLAAFFLSYFFNASKDETVEEATDGSASIALGRVFIGAIVGLLAIPVFLLIWGSEQSDISDLWFSLNEGIPLGETRVSLTDFLVFGAIFFVGYSITRLIQSVLRTLVLPNTKLDIGAQNAIATGLGYLGLFLSGLFAILSTGLDLSSLAIVAGALSLGIGFGLQAIVSNFVSGIILLIERPIKKGDWVEVGAYSGYVQDISVRSTSIETFDKATVTIPNADLIAGSVTNWTHKNVRGRVIVPVGVAYGTDPRKVENLLLEIAQDQPMILKNPKPWVVFMGLGASSMDFELRGIVRDVNDRLGVQSDINYEVVERFNKHGIEIPFPQSEITLKNATDLARKR